MTIESAKVSRTVASTLPNVTCEIITIDRRTARHLIDTCAFPRQRDISDKNILRLRREMENGWYVHGTPLYFAVLPDGTQYLLNGHHSLNAVVDAQAVLRFTAIYHPVADLAEAGHLYSRFDIHKRRSHADSYRAVGLEERARFPKQWLNGYGAALRMMMGKFAGKSLDSTSLFMSQELQIMAFERYLPFAHQYYDSIVKRGNETLLWCRAPVFGVGLALFESHPPRAHEFFKEASADDGLHRNDPRKLLYEWLSLTPCITSVARRETAIAVALAWNAFYKRGDLTTLQVGSVKELRILGTKWRAGYDPTEELLRELHPAAPALVDSAHKEFTTGTMTTGKGEIIPVTQHVGRA